MRCVRAWAIIPNVHSHAAKEFFASQPVGLRVPGWILGRSDYPTRLTQARHGHAPAYFSLVVRGAYDETIARKERRCTPGDLLFHPAEEEHSVAFLDRPTSILRLELDSELVSRLPFDPGVMRRPLHLTSGRVPAIARRIDTELRRADRVSPLAIEGLALELLAEAFRSDESTGRQAPQWLVRARDIVECCYRDGLTVSSIAEQAGAHRATLARAFRQHYQQSVAEYVRTLRIRDACRALTESDRSLAEIAAEAGFCDQAHFTRVFRRLIGIPPGQFRRHHGGRDIQTRDTRSIQ